METQAGVVLYSSSSLIWHTHTGGCRRSHRVVWSKLSLSQFHGTISSFFPCQHQDGTQRQHTSNHMNKHTDKRCSKNLLSYSKKKIKTGFLSYPLTLKCSRQQWSNLFVENPSQQSICAPEQTSRDRLWVSSLCPAKTGALLWKSKPTFLWRHCRTAFKVMMYKSIQSL